MPRLSGVITLNHHLLKPTPKLSPKVKKPSFPWQSQSYLPGRWVLPSPAHKPGIWESVLPSLSITETPVSPLTLPDRFSRHVSCSQGFLCVQRLHPKADTGKLKGPHERKSCFFTFCFFSGFYSCWDLHPPPPP